MTGDQRPDDGPAPSSGVLGAVRDGWHSLGGGDAAGCPGCPVCRLTESTGRLDPQTAAHLQAAAGHVMAAGRELLAALAAAPATGPADRVPAAAPADGEPVVQTADGAPVTESPDREPVTEQPGRPGPTGATRIPVRDRPIPPHQGSEEHT